jgi:HK97 family phage major capsid protein
MAIEDFIPFIQRKLAEKMGVALSYGAAKGKGQPGASDTFKAEPKGIITALLAETNTPQVKTYTAGELAYSDLTAARAKIKFGANGLRIYANSKTIWDELANVKDQNGRPIMVADPINGGVGRIFGIEVKEEDALADGEILFSAPSVGYIANVNKDMSLATEEHVKERTADYCAYAIVDGNVTTTKAHALLKNS